MHKLTAYRYNSQNGSAEPVEKPCWDITDFLYNEKYRSGLVMLEMMEKPTVRSYGRDLIFKAQVGFVNFGKPVIVIGNVDPKMNELISTICMLSSAAIDRAGRAKLATYIFKKPGQGVLREDNQEAITLSARLEKEPNGKVSYAIRSSDFYDLDGKLRPQSTLTLFYDSRFIEKGTGNRITNNIILKDLPFENSYLDFLMMMRT